MFEHYSCFFVDILFRHAITFVDHPAECVVLMQPQRADVDDAKDAVERRPTVAEAKSTKQTSAKKVSEWVDVIVCTLHSQH